MYRFILDRREDISGTSGTGIVVEGVVCTDGTTVLKWLRAPGGLNIYTTLQEAISIHGHEGRTSLVWVDPPRDPGHPAWQHETHN